MSQTRPQTPALIFSVIAAVAIIAALILVNKLNSAGKDDSASQGPADTKSQTAPHGGDSISLSVNGKHVDEVNTGHAGTPEELVGKLSEIIIQANKTGDIQPFIELVGRSKFDPEQVKQLQNLATNSRLQLNHSKPFSELKNNHARWALNLLNKKQILLDLDKDDSGAWKVNKVTLTEKTTEQIVDHMISEEKKAAEEAKRQAEMAEATIHQFIAAILKLDPIEARNYVDPEKISYATLAGLCILFEEGHYRLNQKQAVRQMFLQNTSAGWVARVETPEAGKTALIAISSKRKDKQSAWKITEVNLDKLLSDYAGRLSDGDIHYVPLLKNPKGGDSLVLYFKHDSKELTHRTQSQLRIVSQLLQTDKGKKLTISGHTDALGSDDYNFKLSNQRAQEVRSFIIAQGIEAKQINVVGFGKSQPRRPNTSDDGRRANRRAEILLDF